MKMTGNSIIQGLIPLVALSIGLCFTSSAQADSVPLKIFFLDPSGKEFFELGPLRYVQVGPTSAPQAYSINDAGQLAGTFYNAEDSIASFITGPNVDMPNLGTLGGKSNDSLNITSAAFGINNTGQVVGLAYTAAGEHRGFITGPNGVGMTDIGTLGGNRSVAYGINDAGQVVGWSYTPITASEQHGFITGPNGVGMTDIGTLGGNRSVAYGINDAGQVVGWSTTAAGERHAFITGPNGMGMTDLGTLGGDWSYALGINDAGQIVGWSATAAGGEHAFITGPNGVGMTDLGTLGGRDSFAYGINDAGQVVGWSYTAASEQHGFITGPNGVGMTDLNSLALASLLPEYVIRNAMGINNAGQVLIVATIPEPETYALMIAGLGLIGFVAWRQKSGNRIQY